MTRSHFFVVRRPNRRHRRCRVRRTLTAECLRGCGWHAATGGDYARLAVLRLATRSITSTLTWYIFVSRCVFVHAPKHVRAHVCVCVCTDGAWSTAWRSGRSRHGEAMGRGQAVGHSLQLYTRGIGFFLCISRKSFVCAHARARVCVCRDQGSVADCPEYVVNADVQRALYREYGLELVACGNNHDYYREKRDEPEPARLLRTMRVIDDRGTLSDDDWEAAGTRTRTSLHTRRVHGAFTCSRHFFRCLGLYMYFAYRKVVTCIVAVVVAAGGGCATPVSDRTPSDRGVFAGGARSRSVGIFVIVAVVFVFVVFISRLGGRSIFCHGDDTIDAADNNDDASRRAALLADGTGSRVDILCSASSSAIFRESSSAVGGHHP